MAPPCARAAGALLLVVASPNAAPTGTIVVAELEPNGAKSEATPIACLGPGVRIQGSTTGAGAAPGDASSASADTFDVTVCPLPPGIWRHRLSIATSGADEHVLSLRGLTVDGPPASPSIAAGSDATLEVSTGGPGQPHYVQWYGFGRQERVYARVAGTAETTAPYELELESTPVVATSIATALRAGPIVITTAGRGHNTDTELYVYGEDLRPIPGFRNDDDPAGGTHVSRLGRTFAPGVYFLAVARFNVADSALTAPDDAYQLAPVLDFPDSVLSWSAWGSPDVSFAITDAQGAHPIDAQLGPDPFDIAWFRFVVTEPPPPIVTACFGDGTGAPCPCGNVGALGHGCANSVGAAGGLLVATGLASVSADSLVLTGSGMPVSSALYFQGTSLLGLGHEQAFGDGLRCAGGAVQRIDTKTNFGGTSQYPGAGDPPVSVRGMVPLAGGARWYQTWYRNSDPTYCTPSLFNLTNAVGAVWLP